MRANIIDLPASKMDCVVEPEADVLKIDAQMYGDFVSVLNAIC